MKPTQRQRLEGTIRSAQRRRHVIRAAYHAIAEKGFEGLRMREIAKRAGMDHATLHYYFAGKEALIHGVLDYIVTGALYRTGSCNRCQGHRTEPETRRSF